jgi:hypothetical protein
LRDLNKELGAFAAKQRSGGEFTGDDNGRLVDAFSQFEDAVDDAVFVLADGPDPDIANGGDVKTDVKDHLQGLRRAAGTAATRITGLAIGDSAGAGAAIKAWGSSAADALNDLGSDFAGPLDRFTDPSCIPIVNEFKAAAGGD